MIKASFEVQGKNADELWKRAVEQARRFAGERSYQITKIDANRQVCLGSGEVLYYIARVGIEVDWS